VWSYTSSLSVCLRGADRDNFAFDGSRLSNLRPLNVFGLSTLSEKRQLHEALLLIPTRVSEKDDVNKKSVNKK
jgi:hypothetical protein